MTTPGYKPKAGEIVSIVAIHQQRNEHPFPYQYEPNQLIRVQSIARRRIAKGEVRWDVNGIVGVFEKYVRELTEGQVVLDPCGVVGTLEELGIHDPDAVVNRPVLRLLYPGTRHRRRWYEDTISLIQPKVAPKLPTLASDHFRLSIESDAYGDGLRLDGRPHPTLHLLHEFNDHAKQHFNDNSNRETLLFWLELAYEKGRESMRQDIAQLLRPTGKRP